MNRKTIIFNYINSMYTLKQSGDWYTFTCPFCYKNNKMAYNPEYEFLKCWTCDYRSKTLLFLCAVTGYSIRSLLNILGVNLLTDFNTEFNPKKEVASDNSIKLPNGYTPLLLSNTLVSHNARDYLLQRGFELNYLDYLGFGTTEDNFEDGFYGYVLIPFKSFGKLVYYIGRSFAEHLIRYKNPSLKQTGLKKSEIIWNSDSLYLYDKIFITEGVLSAITIGDNAIALLGKTISDYQLRMLIDSPCKMFILCLDGGCYKETYDLFIKLYPFKELKIMYLEHEKDPNDIGKENIMYIESNTNIATINEKFTLLKRIRNSLYNT
jgi:hypothetical protein